MSIPQYKAPELELALKKILEIPFASAIAAGAHLSLVSGRIEFPFRVTGAKMVFTDDANNWIQHRWYVSANRSVSTTGTPSGDNIFSPKSPSAYFSGKGLIRRVYANREYPAIGLYIKLYTFNNSPYAYNISASITIQEM